MFMDFLCITIENLALSLFSCFRKKKHVGLDLHHEAHGLVHGHVKLSCCTLRCVMAHLTWMQD